MVGKPKLFLLEQVLSQIRHLQMHLATKFFTQGTHTSRPVFHRIHVENKPFKLIHVNALLGERKSYTDEKQNIIQMILIWSFNKL